METKVLLKALEVNGFRLSANAPCLLMLDMNEVVAECVNKPLDIKRLQGILMSKGYRVASNDPVFLILTINKILLEEMLKQQQLDVNNNVKSIFSLPEQTKTIKPKKELTPFNGSIAGLSLLFFAGWMIGEVGKTPLMLVSIGLMLGAALGILGMLLWFKSTESVGKNSKSPYQLSAEETWSEMEFHDAIKRFGNQRYGGAIDTKNQIALFDFFCRGTALERVFVRHQMSLVSLSSYMDELIKFKSSQPK